MIDAHLRKLVDPQLRWSRARAIAAVAATVIALRMPLSRATGSTTA